MRADDPVGIMALRTSSGFHYLRRSVGEPRSHLGEIRSLPPVRPVLFDWATQDEEMADA